MQWFTKCLTKALWLHTHKRGITESMRRQYSNSLKLSIAFTLENT